MKPRPQRSSASCNGNSAHRHSSARFANDGLTWASRWFLVAYLVVFGWFAAVLFALRHGTAERWAGFAVFAVLFALVLLLNARALKRRRQPSA